MPLRSNLLKLESSILPRAKRASSKTTQLQKNDAGNSRMPLSSNLLKLESSILTQVKRATNRNNVATEKQIQKKKSSGTKWSRRRNVRRRNVPDPYFKYHKPICINLISIIQFWNSVIWTYVKKWSVLYIRTWQEKNGKNWIFNFHSADHIFQNWKKKSSKL